LLTALNTYLKDDYFVTLQKMSTGQHYLFNCLISKFKHLAQLTIFLCAFQTGLAQTPEIDSLQNVINATEGKEKVDAINALAFKLILTDYEKARVLAIEGKLLAEEIDYTKGISEALISEGVCYVMTGNHEQALKILMIAREKAKLSINHGWEGYALVQIGNIHRAQGHYDSAKIWYDQSFRVLKDSLNPWHLSILYRNLGRNYGLSNQPKDEFHYLKRSLAIREKLGDNVLLADIWVLLSQWHINQSDLEQATVYLQQAERSTDPNISSEVQKDIAYQKASILFRNSNYKDALNLFDDVRQYYIRNTNPHQLAVAHINIAELLEETGNYDVSLKNGFEALRICEKNNFLNDAVKAKIIIGQNYYRLNQLKTAQEFADAAVRVARDNSFETEEARGYSLIGHILKVERKYPDALFNYEKALEIRKKLENKKYIAASLSDVSQIYELQGKLRQALVFQKQSVAIKESILHQTGLAWGYFDLGSIYTKLKDFSNAEKYLDMAEGKARYVKSGIILLHVYETRRDLLVAQNKTGEALRYSFLYEELKDSVNSTAIANRVLSLQSVYDLEKKDHEIELLNKNKQVQEDEIVIQRNRIQRQQFFIGASIVGLILLAALAFMLYIYFKRMARLNKEVREQNREIQAQSEELSERNASLITLNRELAEKQEEIQAQSEELTETNNALVMLNMELAEKHEELTAQSEELSEANTQFVLLNNELATKQNELEAQSEELRESYDVISELNESLEQKVRERTAEMKQAYKELDTFFYRSSHDFRRPLTTFMGLSEVAKITVKDQNALNLFEKVKETAINLDRMLIKLQSISDVGAHQFVYREVSMQTIFENALDTYQEAIDTFGIRISVNVGEIKNFLSYPAFLKIIIENLLENSIQFRGRNDPQITMAAIEKYGGVEITVKDNGQGVEEEYQDRLFDMFFRGNELSKGNGLGLYIVKKAVSKLSGTLHLETTFGKGMTISIWIPIKQANPDWK
jgi:signal transduction histidine kinase/tetratricopeptide (TPR) repeat protein